MTVVYTVLALAFLVLLLLFIADSKLGPLGRYVAITLSTVFTALLMFWIWS